MSLFIDVIDVLSNTIKMHIKTFLESERKDEIRAVRKICDLCIKYLDYGELSYYLMEESLNRLSKDIPSNNSVKIVLYAVLNESLDEDAKALEFFEEFAETSYAAKFKTELLDFIEIGKLVTLKEYDKLVTSGSILVNKYTNEQNVSDTLSNLYFKEENENYIPSFLELLKIAKNIYPQIITLESLNGFINLKAKKYDHALASFLNIKDKIVPDTENRFYNFNLASTWDNIAGCYLKLGNASKTLESCDIALKYDELSEEDFKAGNSILYKKAEALIMEGSHDKAKLIIEDILKENEEDHIALEIKSKLENIDHPNASKIS